MIIGTGGLERVWTFGKLMWVIWSLGCVEEVWGSRGGLEGSEVDESL